MNISDTINGACPRIRTVGAGIPSFSDQTATCSGSRSAACCRYQSTRAVRTAPALSGPSKPRGTPTRSHAPRRLTNGLPDALEATRRWYCRPRYRNVSPETNSRGGRADGRLAPRRSFPTIQRAFRWTTRSSRSTGIPTGARRTSPSRGARIEAGRSPDRLQPDARRPAPSTQNPPQKRPRDDPTETRALAGVHRTRRESGSSRV